MKKRLLAAVVGLALMTLLVACSSKEEPASEAISEATVAEEASVETIEDGTDVQEEESSEQDTEIINGEKKVEQIEEPSEESSEDIVDESTMAESNETVSSNRSEPVTEEVSLEADDIKTNHIRLADGTIVEAGESIPADKVKNAVFVFNGKDLKEGEEYNFVYMVTKAEYLVANDSAPDWVYEWDTIKQGDVVELENVDKWLSEGDYSNIYINFVNAAEREEALDKAFDEAYDEDGNFNKDLYKIPVMKSETELNFSVE